MACFVSALTVRFLTRRFIGEYDENLGECVNSMWGAEGGHGGTTMPLHNDPPPPKKKILIYLSYFLEMTYTHHMNLDGQNVALVIMDTAGEVSKFN